MILTDEQYIALLKRENENLGNLVRQLQGKLTKECERTETLACKGQRLALELECLLMDTRDTAIQSKWWDSAHEALEDWRDREIEVPE